MRICLALLVGLTMAGCSRENSREPAARQAGRDAYHASKELERGAKKAGEELRDAGKELRKGWNEAKREDAGRPKK